MERILKIRETALTPTSMSRYNLLYGTDDVEVPLGNVCGATMHGSKNEDGSGALSTQSRESCASAADVR
jgi:hypothetical protein